MACFKPLRGFKGIDGGISWTPSKSFVDVPMVVPCGRCIGCRQERARQWSVRMMHEAKMHADSCFLTLTYDPEHLPKNWSLDKRHFQLFMKRLRKHLSPARVSFFHCGEYGDENGRPHYHCALFGFAFPDKRFYKRTGSGHILCTSELADKLWELGKVYVGSLTLESAGYVARYVVKKVVAERPEAFYHRCDPDTGEIFKLQPEYATMSTKPGIGKRWYEAFAGDVKAYDGVVMASGDIWRMNRVPRYYDKLRKKKEADAFKVVKRKRRLKALTPKNLANNTDERLAVREECAIAKINLIPREPI